MNIIQRQGNSSIPTIAINGDSQSDLQTGWGVAAHDCWGPVLAEKLVLLGARVNSRIFANAGDTTSQLFARSALMFLYNKPTIAVIYAGVNDLTTTTGTASAGTANTITLASGSKYNSWVGNVITITSGTGVGQTKTITAYNSTTFIARVDSNWSVTPNSTSVYSIAPLTTLQTQLNTQALIKSLKYNAIGTNSGVNTPISFWNQSELPANGSFGERYVIMSDNSTTGGSPNNGENQHNTILGDYSGTPKQSVWEYRSKRSGEAGWGRVAIAGTPTFKEGIDKIVCVSTNYNNWTTGGDNLGAGIYKEDYRIIRTATKQATVEESVVYCDLFDFQSKLISGGTFEGKEILSETSQGDNSWHAATNNQHHNAYGHETVARAVLYTILNQGWLSSLL